MNKLRRIIQDQEIVISEQQSKITKLQDENSGMAERIDKSPQRQELEGMRRKLHQCETTILYMSNLMVKCNQVKSETLVEAESSENINEAKEDIRHKNGSLIGLDIVKLYRDVMNDMKIKFQSGELNQDQKIACKRVIIETQSLLGQKSFEVLGFWD